MRTGIARPTPARIAHFHLLYSLGDPPCKRTAPRSRTPFASRERSTVRRSFARACRSAGARGAPCRFALCIRKSQPAEERSARMADTCPPSHPHDTLRTSLGIGTLYLCTCTSLSPDTRAASSPSTCRRNSCSCTRCTALLPLRAGLAGTAVPLSPCPDPLPLICTDPLSAHRGRGSSGRGTGSAPRPASRGASTSGTGRRSGRPSGPCTAARLESAP